MSFVSGANIVNGPSRTARETFDIYCQGFPLAFNYCDVYGLLVAKRQVSVGTQPVKHRENIKLSREIGVVSGHEA